MSDMDEETRKQFVDEQGFTFDGEPCHIGGWRNKDHASISTDKPGIYGVTWETIAAAANDKRDIPRSRAWLSSQAWLGTRRSI